MKFNIERRDQRWVNTDPQRRCYNGVNAREELRWADWEVLEYDITEDRIEQRLKFWCELNDYAVSERGEGARSEFRVPISVYRRHSVYLDQDGYYYEMYGSIRRCNSAWSCKVSIDEELSP